MKGFEQRVNECRTMLDRSDADQEIRVSGAFALLAAKNATGPRNRIVHDMWLPDSPMKDSEPRRWNAFRLSGDVNQNYKPASSHGLDVVVDAHTLLVRTRLRVSGLFMALHALWPTGRNRGNRSPDDGELARYVALMADRFTLHANGDFDIT